MVLFQQFYNDLFPIFVATADSIPTPRLNNLMLDINYLKKYDRAKYNLIFQQFSEINYDNLWQVTEKFANIFNTNSDRPNWYWANIEKQQLVALIQNKINLPINNSTFTTVRESLYTDILNYSLEIKSLNRPFLWINGFQDYIMDSHKLDANITTFYKSAHYPHIEENELFCQIVNKFLRSKHEKNSDSNWCKPRPR